MKSDSARLFALGFKRGWKEAPLSQRALIVCMIASAIVTSALLVLQRIV